MSRALYASLEAFLAHWRALNGAPSSALTPQELARRKEMNAVVAQLRPEERAALEQGVATAAPENSGAAAAPAAAGALRRHRQRARLDLARALGNRGMLVP